MSNHAIASSGNLAEDLEALRQFEIRDKLIRAGNCPNGCGGMGEVDPYNAICLKCGFMYFCGSGLNFEQGTPQ